MAYVDGFVIPIAKSKVKAYLKMARLGAKIWKQYGALAYYECMGFPKMARLKRGETVVFSFIVYRSRAQRDKINAKVMKDPIMNDPAMMKNMPFDMKRFCMGGFKVLVSW